MGRLRKFSEGSGRSPVPAVVPALKRGLGAACERAAVRLERRIRRYVL